MTVKQAWDRLLGRVGSLRPQQQTAFATFSCGRAAIHYNKYCKEEDCKAPDLISGLLRQGWERAKGSSADIDGQSSTSRLRAVCTELEENGSPKAIAAQEACFGAMVLVEVLSTGVNVDQVLRIVNFTRDITDMVVQETPDFAAGDDIETAVLAHPFMQDELQRHSRALELLSGGGLNDSVLSALERLSRA